MVCLYLPPPPTLLWHALGGTPPPGKIISFHFSPFDPSFSFIWHTSSPLFSSIIAWERSLLLYCLHAKSRSGKKCRKVPCALSAGRKKKRVHTPVEDKQGFHRYDMSIILAQDMNSSVIWMVKEALHSGTVSAERHVLHCLAAGIPRSGMPPNLPKALITCPHPVLSVGSDLQTQPCPVGSSLGCWEELSRILWPPSHPLCYHCNVNTQSQVWRFSIFCL